MERAEAAAKGWGGADGAAEGVAGEGGADEAREVGQAEEDLSEEVVAESSDSGATGRRLLRDHGRRLWRIWERPAWKNPPLAWRGLCLR